MDTGSRPSLGDSRLAFYADALRTLERARLPFLIGGAFAYSRHTERDRETKDLDIVVRPGHVREALGVLADAGYEATLPFPHWLGKVHYQHHYMDVVFGSGNGVVRVDDDWFTHSTTADILGMHLPLCPAEELLWSMAFVQERERFDGGDVVHLVHDRGATLDWNRLMKRFGPQWPVLLGHLVVFLFAFPARRHVVPRTVIDELTAKVRCLQPEPDNPVCFGTLLSREQYLLDLDRFGYQDGRLWPHGRMSREQADIWTEAIADRDAP